MIKNIIESKNIIFYARYVDDISIIYDHSKITSKQILQYSNAVHNNLQLKLAHQNYACINILELLLKRTSWASKWKFTENPLPLIQVLTIIPTATLNIN
jgi:hypothetical protein